jgi:hypothetical protein
MNAPLEDQLRSSLQRHAAWTPPPADAGDVRRRVQRRRRRRHAVPALGAAVAVAAGVAITTRADHGRDRTATAASGETPDQGSAIALVDRSGGLAFVELPGWQLERYAEIRYPAGEGTAAVSEPEYQWTRDGRRMQLHLYPGGRAMYDLRVGGDVRQDVEAFGRPASLLDYGTGRYRVDVLIGEDTYEFDGESFASADAFFAAIGAARSTATAPPAEVTEAPLELKVPFDPDVNEPVPGEAPPPDATSDTAPATGTPAGK